jgi:hypothetical protein
MAHDHNIFAINITEDLIKIIAIIWPLQITMPYYKKLSFNKLYLIRIYYRQYHL